MIQFKAESRYSLNEFFTYLGEVNDSFLQYSTINELKEKEIKINFKDEVIYGKIKGIETFAKAGNNLIKNNLKIAILI